MNKVVRDGKVAVLIAPSYGAGWYTENLDENLLFDPILVQYVEENNKTALKRYAKKQYPNAYIEAADDLTVRWIKEGILFRVKEYDGSESIEVLEDLDWIKA